MKKMLFLAVSFIAAALCADEIKIDFNASSPWKEVRNHSKRLTFENKEFLGKKATVVSLPANTKPCDTAFSLGTAKFSVKGKKAITVKYTWAGAKKMNGFKGGAWWRSAVQWYDGANKEIPATLLPMAAATGAYQSVTREIPVPAGAVTAYVHFGFDSPNITPTTFFAITDVSVIY